MGRPSAVFILRQFHTCGWTRSLDSAWMPSNSSHFICSPGSTGVFCVRTAARRRQWCSRFWTNAESCSGISGFSASWRSVSASPS